LRGKVFLKALSLRKFWDYLRRTSEEEKKRVYKKIWIIYDE